MGGDQPVHAADGTPVIFLHGWPDLALGWRHQLLALGALGFRALAPDMRGYGQSTVHPAKTDYALEACVADMLELLASTGREAAVWVGHDLGAPVAWAIASHHPERTLAVAALCVPYMPQGMSPPKLVELVDRSGYDSLWVGDHISFHIPIFDPLLQLVHPLRDRPLPHAVFLPHRIPGSMP